MSHPGTVLETREQELSFGTKINEIVGLTDKVMSLRSLDWSSTSHQA